MELLSTPALGRGLLEPRPLPLEPGWFWRVSTLTWRSEPVGVGVVPEKEQVAVPSGAVVGAGVRWPGPVSPVGAACCCLLSIGSPRVPVWRWGLQQAPLW